MEEIDQRTAAKSWAEGKARFTLGDWPGISTSRSFDYQSSTIPIASWHAL